MLRSLVGSEMCIRDRNNWQMEGAPPEETSIDPGFELGEDVKNSAQEERWSKPKVDGRAHWSHRELSHKYAQRIRDTIGDYGRIEMLSLGISQESSPLFAIGLELLQLIVAFACPGHTGLPDFLEAVSYTHLTLPTKRIVECSVGAG
eukprot:TRINITY_DN31678_c0_g1_i1.p1 TRINITY_DN31678_c0_g1~~TRINITY_DN31678_c0_g1_i1.p1  ORF type:complete len:147 (+),score=40.41 TRINITY_DN31678_c0_g1_i1:111-551(+)